MCHFAMSNDVIWFELVLYSTCCTTGATKIASNPSRIVMQRMWFQRNVIDPARSSVDKTGAAALSSDILMMALSIQRNRRRANQRPGSISVSWSLLASPVFLSSKCKDWTSLNVSKLERYRQMTYCIVKPVFFKCSGRFHCIDCKGREWWFYYAYNNHVKFLWHTWEWRYTSDATYFLV